MKHRNEKGQATVEIALLIPMLAIFLLLILQVAIVVRQHVLVGNASREAARVLTVENNSDRARKVVHDTVENAQVIISRPSQKGDYLTVTVKDVVKSNAPILGLILPDITVSSKSTMRVEK